MSARFVRYGSTSKRLAAERVVFYHWLYALLLSRALHLLTAPDNEQCSACTTVVQHVVQWFTVSEGKFEIIRRLGGGRGSAAGVDVAENRTQSNKKSCAAPPP